jgi:hypothetical protein
MDGKSFGQCKDFDTHTVVDTPHPLEVSIFSSIFTCHIVSYPARMILFLTFIVLEWVTELTISCVVISPTPRPSIFAYEPLICWEIPELAMEVCGKIL